jgi:hypothetical protein
MNAKKTPDPCPIEFPACEAWRNWVTSSLEEGARQFDEHQTAIAENTALTKQVEQNTRELVEMLTTIKSGAAVLAKLGRAAIWLGRMASRVAKWAIPLVTLGGIIYGLLHGQWPTKGE